MKNFVEIANATRALYAKYIQNTYVKDTIVRVRKVEKYHFEGDVFIAVHHVESDGTIIGYTCHGEYWELSYGDTFARYIPIIRSGRR